MSTDQRKRKDDNIFISFEIRKEANGNRKKKSKFVKIWDWDEKDKKQKKKQQFLTQVYTVCFFIYSPKQKEKNGGN